MSEKVAVVIPYYAKELSEVENISYRQCLKKLYKHPIILLVPASMEETDYPKDEGISFIKVPSEWLSSVTAYNMMMLNVEFYKLFIKYKYILIYQLDALVFTDELYKFCEYGFDYIGAPWPYDIEYPNGSGKIYSVGNGGFSLRKIESFINLSKNINPFDIKVAEDVFWASCVSDRFRVAPVEIAIQFAFEAEINMSYKLLGERLPFGCHAWNRFDCTFFKKYLCSEGYNVEDIVGEEMDYINEIRRVSWERRMRKKLFGC